ncbi:alpha/beta hydrolase [Rhizobium sp. C4]|uniref:alpha/beta hydrolase n=1 Tax=Rhizobium sp. C4 TaxID=1349800 RepID=UPI001E3399B0|nr:alpha/beta hydrolase [Rhizobium sp. C4]MCD2173261.1 alpha/beta hydrolase [Rhizobium sp. C4]
MILRKYLIAAAFLALTVSTVEARDVMPQSPEQVLLWPEAAPGGGGPKGPLKSTPWGALSQISSPDISVFKPEKQNGGAVLIIPGGGYRSISAQGEGYSAAKWLNDRGFTAFVLTYRLPGESWGDGPKVAIEDAQRAIRLIRANAASYGIDKGRVGVLGFSAGGHLAGLVATRFAETYYEPIDKIDTFSARPDWVALVYPVVSLEPPFTKTSTHRQMVGRGTVATEAQWSVQTGVNTRMPPVFLVHAADDPIANVAHSEIMDAACKRAKVPVDFVRLPTGGHGFAMGRPGTASITWSKSFEQWLKRNDNTAVSMAATGRERDR